MNKKDVAYHERDVRVEDVFQVYSELVANIPLLQANADNFISRNNEFKDLAYKVSIMPAHPAGEKQTDRSTLQQSCIEIGGCIKLNAQLTDDQNTVQKILDTNSELKSLTNFDFLNYAQFIQEYCDGNAEALAQLGITELKRTQFADTLESFKTEYEQPQDIVNQRKIYNSRLHEIIIENNNIIPDVFDPLMKTFDQKSEFVKAYKVAKEVHDPATHHRDEEEVETNM